LLHNLIHSTCASFHSIMQMQFSAKFDLRSFVYYLTSNFYSCSFFNSFV